VSRHDEPERGDASAARDAAIAAILESGRQTRKPLPRALWIAAGVVAVICATGIVAILVGGAAPDRGSVERPSLDQRRDHSSRNRP
jgi:amino acid transporter